MSLTEEVQETHQDCPHCGGHECVTVFDDGGTYCHQCPPEEAYRKPKAEKKGSRRYQTDTSIEYRYSDHRGISKETNEALKILTGFKGGAKVNRVYKYPHDTKCRWLPKTLNDNLGFTQNHLAGMDLFNAGSSQYITITEGEEDWATMYQVLGRKYPVVNIPSAQSLRNILKNEECYKYLSAFKNIVIATDSDSKGDEAANTLVRAFPGKCRRLLMTKYKDPNAYIWDNEAETPRDEGADLLWAWHNSKPYTPDNIFHTPEQFKTILREESSSMYLPTGIGELDTVVRGLMQGRMTVFQAPEGIGKTEFMRYLEWNLLDKHPTVPIAIMHMEETKKRSLLGLASYALNTDVTQQDTEVITNEQGQEEVKFLPSYNGVSSEEVDAAIESFSQRENLYQFTLNVDEDPSSILEQIRYFREVHGVRYVFFEPIQDLAYSREDDGTVEQFLSKLSTKMARLCPELNVGVVTIAHENDDGQIRDCRMIGKRADVVIKLERDKDAIDTLAKNTTTLRVVKNRPTGTTGYAGQLFFDTDSFTLGERE